jgi:TetR/AcrR family transcriptional regulator, transcriptional repressor for nem operon
MRDLATTMGLSAPSLYNTFGEKQALFARALEHCLDHTTRLRLRRLETWLAHKQATHRFFDEIIKHSVVDRQRKGCFLINLALEIAPHDHTLGAVIADRLGELAAFFRRRIKNAQADGTAPRGIDAKDVARIFLEVPLGIRVLARSNPNRFLLEGVVRSALALPESSRNQRKKTR